MVGSGLVRNRMPRTARIARVVAGLVFVLFGLAKFVFHGYEVAEFARFGFADAGLLVHGVGVLEVVGGIALVAGRLVRPAAALLAVDMLGAVSTAGVTVGGPIHLGLAPVLLLTMLFLVWAGAGRAAAITPRAPA
ncbi:DoxX family protein [Pseudonocardia endophytica]|uniref:Putative oxidoreductase n=1 Tax=Pseudonocardia endophytica TaxID=401976 RepID=A0A4R1HEN8_PSEEN|nr:DoxX family membrane protein [Pseudonocardia endophytica]TCK20574.1 putative oxidoreductase [Pseudonocardia endophytica]